MRLCMTLPDALKLALEHHHAGRLRDAEDVYRQILHIKPDAVPALFNLGLVLFTQHRLDEAGPCFTQVIRLDPNLAQAHAAFGNVYKAQGRLTEAIACYERALQRRPDDADTHVYLGSALQIQGHLDRAAAHFQRALELKPGSVEALNNLANVRKDQGRLAEAIATFRAILQALPHLASVHSNLLYTLLNSPDYDAAMILDEHRRWDRLHAQPLAASILPHANDPSPGRRLNVGYVSPDYCDHVAGRNLLPLFRNHDHGQFAIHCYSNNPFPDDMTKLFQSHADVWRDVAAMSDEVLAHTIRHDHIDILVDLALHSASNRLLAFARKPAPVQVTFAGYPGTTGLTAIDYRLTDPYLDPPGLFDHTYSETSIRLADCFWCYDAPTREPAVNPLPALQNGFVTFGCLNNFCKVNNIVLARWASILQAVANSRLLLAAPEGSSRQATLDNLAAHNIAPGRVTFVPVLPRLQYLELYHQIDLALDTLPYNGHTTSLDALWMGVPVVTLVGTTVVGRAGFSQLSNVGLNELVAESPEQFTHIAIELAKDLPRLGSLRAGLRARMEASPLMDSRRFTRNIENAYREMWQAFVGRASQPVRL